MLCFCHQEMLSVVMNGLIFFCCCGFNTAAEMKVCELRTVMLATKPAASTANRKHNLDYLWFSYQ